MQSLLTLGRAVGHILPSLQSTATRPAADLLPQPTASLERQPLGVPCTDPGSQLARSVRWTVLYSSSKPPALTEGSPSCL